MKKIYTGIDIGSDSIKMMICEEHKNKFNILAVSSKQSKGIKKGLIVNAEEVTPVIMECIKELELMVGVKIDKVIANVPAYFAHFSLVDGYSTITNQEREVKGNDIVRAMQACIYNKLPEDRELVTIVPIEFSVDDEKGIKEPKGKVGTKLGVKAVMVTTPKKNVYSIVSIMNNIGIDVTDITIGSIGDYALFKTAFTESSVGAVINIGAETTNVAIFNRGIIVKNEVIELGGKNIDNDLAYIYKIDKEAAKELKEKFAVANKRYADINETYNITNLYNEELVLNQYEVSEVVMSRILEILKLSKKQINLLTNKEISYIIVTGGVSELVGFHLIVEEVLGKNAFVGNIKTIGVRHNNYSSVYGILKHFNDKLVLRGKEYSMFNREKQEDLISTKKKFINFSNDSVIGKVFGYFFDNN
ncbi:MAG: cell division protein FtsA [Bacilli bacterium]|nr:cell division protein FtsA [Bacilli bacterium]